MNVCLLAAMLAVAQAPPAVPPGGTYAAGHDTATVPPSPAVPTLDGQWTLIYAERDGRIQEVSHERAVTIRGDALTLTRDGRPQTFYFELAPNRALTVYTSRVSTGGQTVTAGTGTPGTAPAGAGTSTSGYEAPVGTTAPRTEAPKPTPATPPAVPTRAGPTAEGAGGGGTSHAGAGAAGRGVPDVDVLGGNNPDSGPRPATNQPAATAQGPRQIGYGTSVQGTANHPGTTAPGPRQEGYGTSVPPGPATTTTPAVPPPEDRELLTPGAHAGTYIVSQEYLAIAVDPVDTIPTAGTPAAATTPHHSLVLFLRKAPATPATPGR